MIDYKNLMRDPLKDSTVYVAGGFKLALKDPRAIRLNANENPFGPSPVAKEAMTKQLERGSYYPGDIMYDFKNHLAEFLNMETANLNLYNGSGSAINAMGDLFLNPGDEVLICSPTYMQYYDLPSHYAAKLVEVPAKDGLYTDLDAMYAAITPKTKLIFVCNPNNPTGTLLENGKLAEFVAKLPKNIICVVDEAYFDWVTAPDYKSAVSLVSDENSLVVFRTFSKIYGMAGIRMGYAVSNKALSSTISMSAGMFYSNRIAAAGAMASIDDLEFYKKVKDNNTEQRKYLSEEMNKMGIDVVPSQTSFIYFNPHADNEKIMAALEEKFIFIRRFDDPYLRVSVGKPEQNQIFLDALKEILADLKK
ncbi:MAG: histidinol-phosphate transaminase [Treponema sp.]|nr:histidinol-phosphate transaminase [Candidatus Treponema equifaecale]